MADKTVTYYTFTKASLIAALGESDVIAWQWDTDKMLLRHTDVETPDNPKAGITRIQEEYSVYSKEDLKALLFPGSPNNWWTEAWFEFDEDNVYIRSGVI